MRYVSPFLETYSYKMTSKSFCLLLEVTSFRYSLFLIPISNGGEEQV